MSAAGQRNWLVAALARGFALFFGAFALAGVAGAARSGARFDASIWWIALPFGGRYVSAVLLAVAGALLVAYALRPRMARRRRMATVAACLGLAAVAVWNVAGFYLVWRAGEIRPGTPLPLSLVVAAVMTFVAWGAAGQPAPRRRRWAAPALIVLTAGACAVLFPLAQVLFFGETDYRRDASVAVVFGAQVHANGKASTSLLDRMNTAIELYDEGFVDALLVSGGVGESGHNEALVMRDMAVAAGVPAEAVIVDGEGVNTAATVTNSLALLDARSAGGPSAGLPSHARIIAVSQFYHLPRIKLTYARAGRDVVTVPARGSQPIAQTPSIVAREIPAFWLYFARAVAG